MGSGRGRPSSARRTVRTGRTNSLSQVAAPPNSQAAGISLGNAAYTPADEPAAPKFVGKPPGLLTRLYIPLAIFLTFQLKPSGSVAPALVLEGNLVPIAELMALSAANSNLTAAELIATLTLSTNGTNPTNPTIPMSRYTGWRSHLRALIRSMGTPADTMAQTWVGRWCVFNGLVYLKQAYTMRQDRINFPTPSGEPKVATYNVMNLKYRGFFRAVLFTHILSGSTVVLGSMLAVALEGTEWAQPIALVVAVVEFLFHGPTALLMSPITYGDKAVTPFVYHVVSLLLMISALSAIDEATDPARSGGLGPDGALPELRRLSTTIAIFLYVRLYGVMRGPNGMLRPQKYTVAVLIAGLAMMPVGWQGWIFPLTFWTLLMYNRETAATTERLIAMHGVDVAATMMKQEPFAPKLLSTSPFR